MSAPLSHPDCYESRVTLRPEARRGLASVLDRGMTADSAQFAHRMLWTLFADHRDRERDFLFLVERPSPFTAIVRSARPPVDPLGGGWEISTRPFAPVLSAGMALHFRLRAVASLWRPSDKEGAKRGKREDVVMSAWKRLPEGDRTPEKLEEVAEKAAHGWLLSRAGKHGFAVDGGGAGAGTRVEVVDYDRARIARGRGKAPIQFGALIFEGLLTVTDSEPFQAMLRQGLGAGRAFGNGLMQIAPAGFRPGAGS